MADAEAARGAGEATVGDQRHLVAHALPVERGGGRQHLAHARAALGAFVADDQHLAFLERALLDRGEGVLLAVEDARGAFEDQPGGAGDLDVGAVWRERASEADDTTCARARVSVLANDLLIGVPA